MEPSWQELLLVMLATWRITHLLANEDGPGEIVLRLRVRLGASWLGRLMDCFYCLSLWVALPAAACVATGLGGWIVAWLGLSGAACLLERLGRPADTNLEMNSHGMLWTGPGHPESGDAAAPER